MPRDRDGSFSPQLVKKRQRRLSGIDDLVISLSAKGLTHGEISAHLGEVYGAQVSKQSISVIIDRVLEGLSEWQNRPLVYPVMFIDAINVKIRDGNVANRPNFFIGMKRMPIPIRLFTDRDSALSLREPACSSEATGRSRCRTRAGVGAKQRAALILTGGRSPHR